MAVRQSKFAVTDGSGRVTLDLTPLFGNSLFVAFGIRTGGASFFSGWTSHPHGAISPGSDSGRMGWRDVILGEDAVIDVGSTGARIYIEELEGQISLVDATSFSDVDTGTQPATVHGGTMTPTAGKDVRILTFIEVHCGDWGGTDDTTITDGAGWTRLAAYEIRDELGQTAHPLIWVGEKYVTNASGGYSTAQTINGSGNNFGGWAGLSVAIETVAPPPEPGPIVGVYDKDDVFLDTLEGAFDVRLRVELDGVGSGAFRIRRDDPKATAELLRPGNYVRAAVPQVDADPFIGFFLEDGDFKLVSSSETGGEILAFSGKGTPSYLTRAIWLADSFLVPWWPAYFEAEVGPPPSNAIGAIALNGPRWYYRYTVAGGAVTSRPSFHTGDFTAWYDTRAQYDRGDGTKITLVHLIAPSVYAGYYVAPYGAGVRDYRKKSAYAFGKSVLMENIGTGTKPGETLRAMFDETQSADRPINPWPLLTADFSATLDSDGAAWTTTDALAGVSAELGDDYLSTIAKLVATGVLDFDLGPDFVLHGYNAPTGRSLGNGSFAAGKVRFVKGVNVADDLSREYSDPPVGTFAEAIGTEDGAIGRAILPTASDWRPREISVRGDTPSTPALDALAAAELAFRLLHSDAVGFGVNTPIVGAEDELAGLYLPGPSWTARGNYWLGDFVRLHTGSAENDFDEETVRIAAITLWWTEAKDLRVIPEVISALGGIEDLGFGSGSSSGGSSSGAGGVSSGGSGSASSDLYQKLSERDQVSGYPSLDDDGKVPFDELDLDWHPSVRVVATTNIALASLVAGAVVDGITLAEGDPVLLTAETLPKNNGVYQTAAVAATAERRADFDASVDFVGAVVLVREGTVNGGTAWRNSNATDPVIGTTGITFARLIANATTLDDLLDVIITAAAAGDRLRFDGTNWRNSALVWKPVMASNPSIVTTDGSAVWVPLTTVDGEPVLAEVPL